MDEIVSFGDWVRRRRKVMGLTQAALAEAVGCAVVTIKKIEQEERLPSAQMAQLLAESLSIPVSLRADFFKMGRGQFVPTVSLPAERLAPPAFLQLNAPLLGGRPEEPVFVAREREIGRLEEHLAASLAGRRGQVVFILGEAGSGKTRLMSEFARQAEAAHPDLLVVEGHCNAQSGSGAPYVPFREILEQLTGDLETRWAAGSLSTVQALRLWNALPQTVQAVVERGPALVDTLISAAALMRRLSASIGEVGEWLGEFQAVVEQQKTRPVQIPQKEQQGQLLDQVTQVLLALAARQPLLMLLDDLQWVDDASNQGLFALGRSLAGSRILILGAYRPSEIGLGRPMGGAGGQIGQHPLEGVIHEFKRTFGDMQIDLGRLVPAEGRAFTDAYLDSQPNRLGEAMRETLFQHTRGHALFTVEMVRNLQENGSLVRDEAGKWIESGTAPVFSLPTRVEAVIEQRIHRLDEGLRGLLSAASVEGEVFSVQVVARMAGMEEGLALQRFSRELEQRHRLVREHSEISVGVQRLNRFQFSHSLFQEYLYQRLSQGERRLFHRQVGMAYEAALFGGHPFSEERFSSSAGGQTVEEVEAILGRWDAEGVDGLLPALGHHFWEGQAWGQAAVYALGAGKKALQSYALREATADFERALEALEQLAEPPQDWVAEAILAWAQAAFQLRPYSQQLRQLARAESISRELEDSQRLVEALDGSATVYLAQGLWTQAGPALMECLALAEALGSERLSVRPTYFKGLMTTFVDPRGALVYLDQALALARRYEDSTVEALSLGTQAHMHAQLGEFGQAREELRQAYAVLPRVKSPLTESDVDLLAAWAYLAMGEAGRGLEFAQRSVERAIATDNLECTCGGYNCVGYSQLQMGQIPAAGAAFQEAATRSQSIGALIQQCLARAGLATTSFFGGRVEAAQELESVMAEMQAYEQPVGAATAAQLLGNCWMQSGELARAESSLKLARDFYRQAGMLPDLVGCLGWLARVYEAEQRMDDAREATTEGEMWKGKIIAG